MKLKTIYICSQCQFQNSKWAGQCPDCKGWNTLVEDVINVGKEDQPHLSLTPRSHQNKATNLKLQANSKEKFSTLIREFDRVIGEGFTEGSLTLMSGEPGIGKSTLTLQIASNLSKNKKVLIISGEESVNQIAKRANRLKLNTEKILALNESSLENAILNIQKEKPHFVIIDSIQVISSHNCSGSSGSVSQVRFCTERLLELAKNTKTTILLIGHVTKEGNLAGPRVLEHLVDTVMHLEGDRYQQFRLLRSAKNRFGSCDEVGIFQMHESGLQEVKNASQQFLEEKPKNAIGSSVTVAMEGNRPFLVEVQALVSTSHFGYPKRTAHGLDLNRLQIIIAILEKYANIRLQDQDIFINVVGGIKLKETSSDLAVALAIISSIKQSPLPNNLVAFGEIGLSGEIRKVPLQKKRTKEAKELGFSQIISPSNTKFISELKF